MKEYGRRKPYPLLKCVAFSSTPYISCRVHYLHRTIMPKGSCTHQFRVYSAGFKLIQGHRHVIKSSIITIERALNSDRALGGNVADWSFPGQRDRPRSKRDRRPWISLKPAKYTLNWCVQLPVCIIVRCG